MIANICILHTSNPIDWMVSRALVTLRRVRVGLGWVRVKVRVRIRVKIRLG